MVDLSEAEQQAGRYRQRRRTRTAIVEAATALLAAGRDPSVAEVAEAAEVSRRTVYMHFPTLEHLLIDATLGALSQGAVDEAITAVGSQGRPADRTVAMIEEVVAQSARTLALGRSLLRLTVDQPPVADRSGPVRGYRRVQWIEAALEPLREELDERQRDRLLSALTTVVGWEALIVLQDLRGQALDDAVATVLWTVRALISAATNATDPPPRSGAKTRGGVAHGD
ncbi:TetR family transcriptional regulator [Nakamurella endophytica]|uniref:TetR family transcriptional regulator n=1 Tax=Nakamurella endophytica TaxID=1748367 RepID=A0A917WIS7_9ACTN|nr:TetR family transcriptional regulator [Nakamurella endophytica]GGM09086.1 TetR family transcriptional regulator [Nakamurella endophytica]